MNAEDRTRLKGAGFSAEVITAVEEILRLWEIERLFTRCSYCGGDCYHPDLPKGKYRRRKLPAELFLNQERLGFRDELGDVVCWRCDDSHFQS